MVFSEPFFLFVFLPLALVVINLSAGRGHNVFILAFSLIFYYLSSGLATLVLMASIVVTWLLGWHYRRLDARWYDGRSAGVSLGRGHDHFATARPPSSGWPTVRYPTPDVW